MAARGRLIAFEGGEGSGKSTQAALLAERFGAVLTREPGGTDLGERIRAVLLDPGLGAIDTRAEALLMLAARAQHVAQVIEPALRAGRWVVTDRFAGSTLAYQGYGRGLDLGELAEIAAWSAHGLDADLCVLLELPVAVATRRRSGSPDRLEAAGEDFHEHVTVGYRELAARYPSRWAVVDGDGRPDEVASRVVSVAVDRLGDPATAEGRR